MASLSSRPDGTRKIQFRSLDGRRRPTIYLGKIDKRDAEDFRRRVEDLLLAKSIGRQPDAVTCAWLDSLPIKMRKKLSRAGLIGQADFASTLKELVDHYLAITSVSAAAKAVIEHTAWNLRQHFGDRCELSSLTEAAPKAFHKYLRESGRRGGGGLAVATASKRMAIAKQIFRHAVDQRWLASNPFAVIPTRNEVNRLRDHFVDVGKMASVLAQTDLEFGAIIRLARWGGLRCPSEIQPLIWDAVDWSGMTLRVEAPKNRNHGAAAVRLVPLFPEIRAALSVLWDAAPEGASLIFPHSQCSRAALSGRLESACRRAGLVMWPKPWQNMRASRVSELLEEYPIHTVAAWLGHSPTVAVKHYAQIAKDHHARAVGVKLGKTCVTSDPPGKSDAKSDSPLV